VQVGWASLAPAAIRITYGGGHGGGSMWLGKGCGCVADFGKRGKAINAMRLLFARHDEPSNTDEP
jgi:hypothetical protein